MTILISDLTNGTNTGILDTLMASVTNHINIQREEGRIRGPEYAQVYTGLIQVAIQQAIQYIAIKADDDIKESQSSQDLANKQAQEELTRQQILSEIQNTALLTLKVANASIEGEVLAEQVLETRAKTQLLEQKVITEYAQTNQSAAGGTPTATLASGLIGAQTQLYNFQTNGFKYKAAGDALKAMTDMWAVATTQSEPIPQIADQGTAKMILDMVIQMYNNAHQNLPTFNVVESDYTVP